MSILVEDIVKGGVPSVQVTFPGSSHEYLTFEAEDPIASKGARISGFVANENRAGDELQSKDVDMLCQWGPQPGLPLVLRFGPAESAESGLETAEHSDFRPGSNGNDSKIHDYVNGTRQHVTKAEKQEEEGAPDKAGLPGQRRSSIQKRLSFHGTLRNGPPVSSFLSGGKQSTPKLLTNQDLEVLLDGELPCEEMPLWQMEGIMWTNYATPLSSKRGATQYAILLSRIALYVLRFKKEQEYLDTGTEPPSPLSDLASPLMRCPVGNITSVSVVARIEPPDLECRLPHQVDVLHNGTEVARRSADIVVIDREGSEAMAGHEEAAVVSLPAQDDGNGAGSVRYAWLRLATNGHRGELLECMDMWFQRRMERDLPLDHQSSEQQVSFAPTPSSLPQRESDVRDYVCSNNMIDLTLCDEQSRAWAQNVLTDGTSADGFGADQGTQIDTPSRRLPSPFSCGSKKSGHEANKHSGEDIGFGVYGREVMPVDGASDLSEDEFADMASFSPIPIPLNFRSS